MIAELIQRLVNGLIVGGGYALMGIGLTLIFGIMRVVNFAHGELYMLRRVLPVHCSQLAGINFFVSSALAVVGVGVVGAVIEHLVLRRLRDQPIEIPMLATVALSNAAMDPFAEDDRPRVLAGASRWGRCPSWIRRWRWRSS